MLELGLVWSLVIAWVALVVVTFAQSAGSTVWDGVFSDEQVKRGERRTSENVQAATERHSKAAT